MKNKVITTVVLLICVALCICQIIYEVRIPEIKVSSAAVSPAYPVIPRQVYFKAWCDARFGMKYIYSDDISFIGKSTKVSAKRFFDNMILSENYAEEYAEGNYFDLVAFEVMDTSGVPLTVYIYYNHWFEHYQNPNKMPAADDFRTQPNYDDEMFQNFAHEGVQYHYTDGKLSDILWYYKEYAVSIRLERDVSNELVIYPEGKDTYFNRLLDPETVQQAVQEMNDVIDWVFYTRPTVMRIISCVGCAVFAVGVVFLIVSRRRKKTVAAAEATEEIGGGE